MKAIANGAINLSTLDGWWDEAFRFTDEDGPEFGWAIGRGEPYSDTGYQDSVEAEALYNILERDVIPAFYYRGANGLPSRWIALMKASIGRLCSRFNTNRMVREYAERSYLPAHAEHRELLANGGARARILAQSIDRIRNAWPQVRAEELDAGLPLEIEGGESIRFQVRVQPGPLTSEDINIELCTGPVNADGEIVEASITEMKPVYQDKDGILYETAVAPCCGSGQFGSAARVLPRHPDLKQKFVPGLITWAVRSPNSQSAAGSS
jgi:starch phosphorylase